MMSFFILPSVISPVVVGLIFRYMLNTEFGFFTFLLNRLGLFKDIALLGNSSTALQAIIAADIWQWTPFLALMFVAGLIALPTEPFEAAKVDGASSINTLFMITLPLLKPVIRVSLMLRIADVVKEFDKIFVMTEGGPGTASGTLNYLSYRVNFRYFQMGKGSAMVFITLVFIILLSIVVLKTLRMEEDIY
jgi:multiple sugar transport system permease protein